MTSPHDLDSLDRDLHDVASRLALTHGDVGRVMARGRRAQHRRRAFTAVAAVAAAATVVAGVGAVVRTGDQGAPVRAGSAQGRLGDVGIDWQVRAADPASSLAGSGRPTEAAGSGPVYRLSTAAGETDDFNAPRVLWRSDDGVAWSPVTTLDSDLFVADLAEAGGRLYAVGTGPSQQVAGFGYPVAPMLAGWSDDGGKTWQHATLPIDLASMAVHATQIDTGGKQVVTGPAGTLVVMNLQATPDVAELAPAGVTIADGWAKSPDGSGIDVLGSVPANPCPPGLQVETREGPGSNERTGKGQASPLQCFPGGKPTGNDLGTVVSPQQVQGVARHLTWAELGITGDFLAAVKGRPIAFLAPPGSTDFERVALADPDPASPLTEAVQVTPVPDGFVAVMQPAVGPFGVPSQPPLALAHSTDGRTWQPLATPPALDRVDVMGTFGGHVYLAGSSVLARLETDGSWTTTDLGAMIDATDQNVSTTGAIGEHGIALVVEPVGDKGDDKSSNTDGPSIVVTRDGATWESWNLADLTQQPAASYQATYVADQIVVSMTVPVPGQDGTTTTKPMVLVGTPH